MEITVSRILGIKNFNARIEKNPKVYKSREEIKDESLDIVSKKWEISGKNFLWNKALNTKVSKEYDYIGDMINGFAAVGNKGKYGFIDHTGKEAVKLRYSEVYKFKDGLSLVARNTLTGIMRYGYINTKGEEVIKPKYIFARSFSEGRAVVQIKSHKWTVINQDGYQITNKTYNIITDYENGFAIVGKGESPNEKYGVIDLNGHEIVKPCYDEIHSLKNGYAKVRRNLFWGIIDSNGKEVVSPIYDKIDFEGDFAIVKNFIYYELITLNGKRITESKYDYIDFYLDKFGRVNINNLWGFIDSSGKEILSPKYSMIDSAYFNDDGLCLVELNDKCGYINENFEEVVKPIYDEIYQPKYGYIIVKSNNKYGLVTTNGEIVADPIYNKISIDEEHITLTLPSPSNPEKDGNSIIILMEEISYDIVVQSENGRVERKFDTIEEQQKYYELLKIEVDKENNNSKQRREELEKKLNEEEIINFNSLRDRVKSI